MFHRILETFFLIQVAVEDVVKGVFHVGEEAFSTGKSRVGKQHKSVKPQAYDDNDLGDGEHTFQDLPAKFARLFRQISRYVFVSFLGALLGKE